MGFIDFFMKINRASSGEEQNMLINALKNAGLMQTDKASFAGKYKGLPATLVFGMGVNYANMGMQAMQGLTGGHMSFTKSRQPNWFFQKFVIDMNLPNEVPPLILKENVGVLRTDQFVMDFVNKKSIGLPEIKFRDISLKRTRIFSTDEMFAYKVASSRELQELLKTWYFLDVRLEGNNLKFIFDDNMVLSKFGKRLQRPDYLIQALDICAAIAAAAK